MSESLGKPLTNAEEFVQAIESDPDLKTGLLAGDNASFEKYFSLAGTPVTVKTVTE